MYNPVYTIPFNVA